MKGWCLILSLVVFSACIDREYEQDSSLRLKKISENEIARLSDLGVWDVWGISQQNGYFLFNSEDGMKVVPMEALGERVDPGISRSRSISEPERGFIAYDFIKEKLLEFVIERNGEVVPRILCLPREKLHLAAVRGKDFIISTGIYEEGRYFYYSMSTGEAKYYLSYPPCPNFPNMEEKTKAILYASSVLRLRPDGRAFVCGDMYSGNIEFCRIEDGNIIQIKRLCFHLPEVKIRGNESIIYKRSNLMGFSDIAASQYRVYALHSGKAYLRNNADFVTCDELMEFDWEGNLLNRYNLKIPVTSIFYNEMEHTLYAVRNKADIPLFKIEL